MRMLLVVVLLALMCTACMRKDDRTVRIAVPDLKTEQDIRIVTNAALNEVAGHFAAKFRCEIDVNRGLVIYHESPKLLSLDYQQRIIQCLGEVGYQARVLAAGHNPPAPLQLAQGEVQDWPDRCTLVLSIPELRGNRDARLVEDALGYARSGDLARVAVDRSAGAMVVNFDPRVTGLKNLERAIAATGFKANETPATDMGPLGWLAVGWIPVDTRSL
jgi:hypothetical protein